MTDFARIHNTTAEEIFLDGDYEQYKNGFDIKPIGLWYAFGRSWLEWCIDEMPDRLNDNNFELTVNPERILVIETLADAIRFSKENADQKYLKMGMLHVDWRKVIARYAGMEIPNYWHIRADIFRTIPILTWLYSWDVPSGVIWDLSAVVSVKKITLEQATKPPII
jgi:hypothetical protein